METSTAPASSVEAHRFGEGPPYTLGVEEEYMLLDPRTFELVARIEPILAGEAGGEFAPLESRELFQSLLEVHTPICAGVDEVARELRRLRRHVAEMAARNGLAFGSAGTHPFALFERQEITERERYRSIVEQLQYAARRELIFGQHVHVALPDPESAIRVLDALPPRLPELVALAASSPFWRGEDTGLADMRQLVFSVFPRSGAPPRLGSWDAFGSLVGTLERTGCIADYTHLWWDARPHPRFGTIEVRVLDAVPRLDDAIALTGYVQCLVKALAETGEPPAFPAPYAAALVHENKWRATRYGLEAALLDLDEPGHVVPVRELVRRRLRELEPHARELGCEDALHGVERILREGNGADAQRQAFAARQSVVDVVRAIAARTSAV